jgi:molecular chaperone DnaJ
MEGKTYYMILGVASTESPGGIRAAYRDLAKRLHPDVAGEQATRAFQDVAEAYRVLSDPQLRRDYNDKLKRAADGDVRVRRPPKSLRRESFTARGAPETLRRHFGATHDRFRRAATGIGVPTTEPFEGLHFEVLLTPDESTRGCVVPLDVPVVRRCPQCGGSGRDGVFPCAYCAQQGMVERDARLHVAIPAMAPAGSVYEILLRGPDIRDCYARLRVVVVEASPG